MREFCGTKRIHFLALPKKPQNNYLRLVSRFPKRCTNVKRTDNSKRCVKKQQQINKQTNKQTNKHGLHVTGTVQQKNPFVYILLAGRIVTSFRTSSLLQEKVEEAMALEILRAHVVLSDSAGKRKK